MNNTDRTDDDAIGSLSSEQRRDPAESSPEKLAATKQKLLCIVRNGF